MAKMCCKERMPLGRLYSIQVVAVARLTCMFINAENYRMKFVIINIRIVVNQQPHGCTNLF